METKPRKYITPKYSFADYQRLNAMSLEDKILKCKEKLWDFYEYNKGNVCVSFSGGKDSTVLLHIARQVYPEIKAVFCDTGLEYPETKQFVNSFDNVDIIRPQIDFKTVIKEYGWCFPLNIYDFGA